MALVKVLPPFSCINDDVFPNLTVLVVHFWAHSPLMDDAAIYAQSLLGRCKGLAYVDLILTRDPYHSGNNVIHRYYRGLADQPDSSMVEQIKFDILDPECFWHPHDPGVSPEIRKLIGI